MKTLVPTKHALLVLLGLASGCAAASPPPAFVAGERARTPKGEVTVIEFVDYECPFCRTMNDDLAPAITSHRDHLRVVRKQVPLAAIHPHALNAARASVCAEEMGKGDVVAEALFRTPSEELTEDGCVSIAARAGLSPSKFLQCMLDPKTAASIRQDVKTFVDVGGGGVPLVWIDDQRFQGQQDPGRMQKAVEDALDDAR